MERETVMVLQTRKKRLRADGWQLGSFDMLVLLYWGRASSLT